MLLLTVICLAGLAPGVATSWYLHHHGHSWPRAVAAGLAVTLAVPLALVATLALFPPIGILVGVTASIAALYAFDKGRVWVAGAYAVAAYAALHCAAWGTGGLL